MYLWFLVLPGALAFPLLKGVEASNSSLSNTDILEIHQVLNKYSRIVDSKSFDRLDEVFLPNTIANYSAAINLFNGTAEIGSTLGLGLQNVTTQHMIGTWVWYAGEVADLPAITPPAVNECGGAPKVKSELYFQASMFGTGQYYGQKVDAGGYFLDNLVKVTQSDSSCAWRIATRQVVHQGPEFGNDTIFSGS